MKDTVKRKKSVIGLVVVFCIVSAIAGAVLFKAKNSKPIINAEELSFVLEFDKNKQNEETDQFIKNNIEDYFIGKDMKVIVKELDYDLTTVSKGKVVKLKENDKTLDDESIKRFIKQSTETKAPISNTDIQDIDEEDYFIGKAVLEDDVEVEFQYRVFDTDFPTIESDDEFELPLNSEDEFKNLVSASDRVEGKLKVEIEGGVKWDKEGVYDLVLKASDRNGNVSQKKVKLTLVDEKEETIANVDTDTETNSGAGNAGSNAGNTGSNTGNTGSNTGNTGSNAGNIGSKPKPQPKPKPVEDNSWKRHTKDFMGHDGVRMYFYKNYGNFEGCHAVADDLLDEMNWNGNWNSTFCDTNGDLYYSEY